MKKNIRTALIGTGSLSTKRIYPYLGLAGMKTVAVCARHLEHAREKCELYGGSPYTDWRGMIETEKPEAVIACVGPKLHFDVARHCLERNIPVYTEKPPASSGQEIDELLNLSEKSKTLCMTGFKKRYALCYLQAAKWLSQFPQDDWACFSLNWYAGKFDLEKNGREMVLLDFGIHALDLVTSLFGPAEETVVFSRNWDSFSVNLRMKNGMVGSVVFSDHRSFTHPSEEMEITVAGGNALSIHNSSSWKILEKDKRSEWFEPPSCLAGGDSGYNTGMLKELEVFADLVRAEKAPLDNLRVTRETYALYEAVKQSVISGGTREKTGL